MVSKSIPLFCCLTCKLTTVPPLTGLQPDAMGAVFIHTAQWATWAYTVFPPACRSLLCLLS